MTQCFFVQVYHQPIDASVNCILNSMKSTVAATNSDNDIARDESDLCGRSNHGILDSDSDSVEEDESLNVNDKMMAELTSYRCGKVAPMTTNPLEFWRANEAVYPHVALQAQKLFRVPATSLPCERLFSAAGILVDRRRSSLRPDHVQQINVVSTELACLRVSELS